MTTIKTAKYPIDFDNLEKGFKITQLEIEEIIGFTYESDPTRYALQSMRLVGQIEARLESSCDGSVTVITRRKDIIVCTDSEALSVNIKRFEQHVRGIIKSCRKLYFLNVANLSSEERVTRDRHLVYMGKTLGSLPKRVSITCQNTK